MPGRRPIRGALLALVLAVGLTSLPGLVGSSAAVSVAPGVRLVRDIAPGTLSSNPARLTAWHGLLFATTSEQLNETVVRSPSGGFDVLHPGIAGTAVLTPNGLVFNTYNRYGGVGVGEMWQTDGTAAGTRDLGFSGRPFRIR